MVHKFHTTRRQFLQHSAAAGLAGAIAACGSRTFAAAPTDDAKKYKKAVKIGMVQVDAPLTEKLKLLKELGFDGVELSSPGGPKPDDVRQAIDESGLPVHGVVDSTHWRTRFSDPNPSVRGQAVDDLRTAIQASKAYGGTSVLVVPGVVDDTATYEEAWQRSIAEIKKALPLAEEEGIHVLIENVWNNFLTDPAETARYIDELDSKMAGAYFDVGNAVRYAPPVDWIRALGDRIVKLDIKEYSKAKAESAGNPGAGFRVKLLEGDCDWPAVMDEMEKIEWSGWGTAEIPGGGRERLQEIASRMDRIFAS